MDDKIKKWNLPFEDSPYTLQVKIDENQREKVITLGRFNTKKRDLSIPFVTLSEKDLKHLITFLGTIHASIRDSSVEVLKKEQVKEVTDEK